MTKYLIAYDYHRIRNYVPLYQLLESWGARRILESMWFADLNGTAAAVRAALKSVADNDDSFVVIELVPGSDWATTAGVYVTGTEWLEANI